jgi:hypothetical protein
MVYGWGCGIVGNFNLSMTFVEVKLFWLLLSTTKSSGVPFMHISEWMRSSPSSSSSNSSGWIFVVAILAMGSMSMIYFHLPRSESKFELESNS